MVFSPLDALSSWPPKHRHLAAGHTFLRHRFRLPFPPVFHRFSETPPTTKAPVMSNRGTGEHVSGAKCIQVLSRRRFSDSPIPSLLLSSCVPPPLSRPDSGRRVPATPYISFSLRRYPSLRPTFLLPSRTRDLPSILPEGSTTERDFKPGFGVNLPPISFFLLLLRSLPPDPGTAVR